LRRTCSFNRKLPNRYLGLSCDLVIRPAKPDLAQFGWLFGLCHQFTNRVKDDLELPIVPLFQVRELSSQVVMGLQHLTESDEGSMISTLTRTARALCNTLESMATPCSVKAYGA